MPQTAQNVADMYKISREECDTFSLHSHEKYGQATKNGFYQHEIVPVDIDSPVFNDDGTCDYTAMGPKVNLKTDEGFRSDACLEKLATLNTLRGIQSYTKDPIVLTAGNCCPTNDGVSACILMSAKKAKALGLRPIAKIVATSVAGIKPQIMGVGPVIAVKKALKQARISEKDIDLIEFNEAFASQVIATMQELNISSDKLNINGGSLAIGHPLGATGIRLVGSLAKSLHFHQNVD